MRSLIFGLLVSLQVWASSPVPETLRDIQLRKPEAFKRAELLYRQSNNDVESARLATILAFAPEGETTTPAHVYAAFSFETDRTLPPSMRLKMAKLAGEGFFNHAQFAKSKSIFQKALAIEGIDEGTREYLEYQLAWCEINQKNVAGAIARLSSWLKQCKQCALRKEMAVDLGKAWAERQVTLPPLDPGDIKPFIEGYASGLERIGDVNLTKTSARLRALPIYSAWLSTVLDGSSFKNLDACQRLTVTSASESALWPKEIAGPAIKRCADNILKEKLATIPSSYVLGLYEALPDNSATDYFALGDLAVHSGNLSKACEFRLEALRYPEVVDVNTHLRALVPVCHGSERVPLLLTKSDLDLRMAKLEQTKRDSLLAYYLSAIVDMSAWKKTFATIPPQTWITSLKPSDVILENLVRDPKWPVDYRLSIWALAPDALALQPQILSELATSLSRGPKEKYLGFIREAQKRDGSDDVFISLLAARKDPSQSISYGRLSGEESWARLTESERLESLAHLFKQGRLEDVVEDWSLWSARALAQPGLMRPIVDALAISEAQPLSGSDVPTQIARAILDWKNAKEGAALAPEIEAWVEKPLLKDLRFIAKTHGTAIELGKIQLNPDASEEQTVAAIERGLALSEKSLKHLRKHKWSSANLARLNREILKRGLAKFRTQIESLPAYAKIGKMVSQWEAKL